MIFQVLIDFAVSLISGLIGGLSFFLFLWILLILLLLCAYMVIGLLVRMFFFFLPVVYLVGLVLRLVPVLFFLFIVLFLCVGDFNVDIFNNWNFCLHFQAVYFFIASAAPV